MIHNWKKQNASKYVNSYEDSKVYCRSKDLFNCKVKDALMPSVKECLSFDTDQIGSYLSLTYNVETRKYYWNGMEYDSVPAAFKLKEE